MANEDNLKPIQDVNEAREKGKKGGRRSGEVRREKKRIINALEILLRKKYELGDKGPIDGGELLAVKLMNIAANQKSKDTDALKAIDMICTLTGQTPPTEIAIKGTEAQSELREYMQLLKGAKE